MFRIRNIEQKIFVHWTIVWNRQDWCWKIECRWFNVRWAVEKIYTWKCDSDVAFDFVSTFGPFTFFFEIIWKKSNQEEESVSRISQQKNLWKRMPQKTRYMKSWWESPEKISNWKKKISIWKKWLKYWNRTIKKKNRKKSHQKWLSHDSKMRNFEAKNNIYIIKIAKMKDTIWWCLWCLIYWWIIFCSIFFITLCIVLSLDLLWIL